MNYYQCKNERKYIYPMMLFCIILFGLLAIMFLGSVEGIVKSGERSEQIISGILFLIIALLAGIATPIYFKVFRKFERTVEITKDEIIYQSKYKTARMKWEKVKEICIFPSVLSLSFNRVVYFSAIGVSFSGKKPRVSDKRIWSEYNDKMLDEIKKYWHGDIINEDKYLKYKAKKAGKLKE